MPRGTDTIVSVISPMRQTRTPDKMAAPTFYHGPCVLRAMSEILAPPVLPYFFAHILTIEILALALAPALVVNSQAHPGFRTPPFLLSPPRGIRSFWTASSQRRTNSEFRIQNSAFQVWSPTKESYCSIRSKRKIKSKSKNTQNECEISG